MTVGILMALATTVVWSLSTIADKVALSRADVIVYGFVRPLVASLLVAVYGLATSTLVFPRVSLILLGAASGLIDMLLGAALFMFAIKRTSAHEAGALANTAPLWGVLAAVLWLGEPATPPVFIAALLVISGAFLLAGRRPAKRGGSSRLGNLAAAAAGLAFAIADTAISKYCLTQGMSPATLLFLCVACPAAGWGLVAAFTGRFRRRYYNRRDLGFAFSTAAVGMFGGQMLWYLALQRAPASVLSPIRGALTLFVFLFSILLLRERPSRRSAIGVALVGAGVLLVSWLR